ncbi:MAG: hypothetical protein J5490_02645 [Bacteroidales bacterium]|nr:hypothetical protein [Bacteroidales bacterium]
MKNDYPFRFAPRIRYGCFLFGETKGEVLEKTENAASSLVRGGSPSSPQSQGIIQRYDEFINIQTTKGPPVVGGPLTGWIGFEIEKKATIGRLLRSQGSFGDVGAAPVKDRLSRDSN